MRSRLSLTKKLLNTTSAKTTYKCACASTYKGRRLLHSVAIEPSLLRDSMFNTMKSFVVVTALSIYISYSAFGYSILPDEKEYDENSTEDYQGDYEGCQNENLTLNFSNAVITSISKNFIVSPIITCLSFKGNQIYTIGQGALNGLPNLRYLNLEDNKLSTTEMLVFHNHPVLETLILRKQRGNAFTQTEIHGIYPALRYLDLSDNTIQEFKSPTRHDKLYSYSEEDYFYSQSQVGSNLRYYFPELRYLNLSNNAIREASFLNVLPQGLTHLYLHDNRLSRFSLDGLSNLIVLTLDRNEFQCIQSCNGDYGSTIYMQGLENLRILSLAENKIDSMHFDAFMGVTNLEYLNLSSNLLQTIDDNVFDDLCSLQILILDNNLLTEVIIKTPLNITYLSMNCNQLESLSYMTFLHLPYLKELYLNSNKIRDISHLTFQNQRMLEKLHLAGNMLSSLPKEWSSSLGKLRYLDLSGNHFTTFESLSLRAAISLEEMYLVSVPIDYLEGTFFDTIPRNGTIYLSPKYKPATVTCKPTNNYNRY